MSVLREEILLDNLNADLKVEKAKLKAKQENARLTDSGTSAFEIEVSKAAIKELESMISEIK